MDRPTFLRWTARIGVRDGQTHPPHVDSKDKCEGWTFLRWTARIGVVDGQTHLAQMDSKEKCKVWQMVRPTFLRWTARISDRWTDPPS